MGGHLSLSVMIGAIFFCSGECGIVLNWSRVLNPWLVLDVVEDLIDEESQRSEMMLCPEGSEWAW